MNKVQNVQVSDTIGAGKEQNADNKKIKTVAK